MAAELSIGLMSGTSCDGMDAALMETDGESDITILGSATVPYNDSERQELLSSIQSWVEQLGKCTSYDALTQKKLQIENGHTCHRIKQWLAKKAGEAVASVIDPFINSRKSAADIDLVIGFHGQTVFHRPDLRFTWQVGDPDHVGRELSEILRQRNYHQLGVKNIIYDFRSHDIRRGGQGAPLVPIYHRQLLENIERERTMSTVRWDVAAVVNIDCPDDGSMRPPPLYGGILARNPLGSSVSANGPGEKPFRPWGEVPSRLLHWVLVRLFSASCGSLIGIGKVARAGGISNVTVFSKTKDDVTAYDTGPGNSLLDDCIGAGLQDISSTILFNEGKGAIEKEVVSEQIPKFDQNGIFSTRGVIDEHVVRIVREMLDPFILSLPPKSLDRSYVQLDSVLKALRASKKTVELVHLVRSLAYISAWSLVENVARYSMTRFDREEGKKWLWVLCGGGRLNPTVREQIQHCIEKRFRHPGNHTVLQCESIGLNGDTLEAEAFAYLAVRRLKGLYGTLPSTTGCQEKTLCGTIHPH